MNAYHEVNFDGIVGPTHHYSGLSYGNVASMKNKSSISNPRRAALEGLAKMKFLADLGIKQGVLPPHERPHLPTLRKFGFSGSDSEVLAKARKENVKLLAEASSASSMWAANAATVSPSADAQDGRLHITPANLASNVHRSIEAPMTTHVLRAIFSNESNFAVHDALPAGPRLGDEGAANHTRLCSDYGQAGVELFIYGRVASDPSQPHPNRFPARQTLEASQAVAQLHQLDPSRVVVLQQHPTAIDAGAFHNDVVAVGNRDLLLFHERAYLNSAEAMNSIRRAMPSVRLFMVPESSVPLADAISSYVFNSQVVTLADGSMSLIAPIDCRQNARVNQFINELLASGDTPIRSAHFVDVRQSMHNGGGPACLRLRVVLSDDQLASINGNVLLTDALHQQLKTWIEKHYRDCLSPDDLSDPKLLAESRGALDELSRILQLGNIYEFQA
ncbi:MAG TPA: N-succinylarginine dihydrolase [Tepidisphaeraceae bacterium]|jgi:succinylarginine dihydrolase